MEQSTEDLGMKIIKKVQSLVGGANLLGAKNELRRFHFGVFS